MARPLRVLMVEDVEADAELVQRQLMREGFTVESRRVETPEAFAAALADQAWDAIICDYAMPRFAAPDALRLLHEDGQDLPFLVVSGTVGEDTAVAMMRAGAHDYIMKGNLARLGPALRRELLEAQLRRERALAQAAFRESEERFRAVFDRTAVGIAVTAMDGTHLDCNPALLQMLGLTKPELLAARAADLTHPDDRSPDPTLWLELVEGQRDSYQRETRLLHADGHVVWVRLTVSLAHYGATGQPVAIAMIEDISAAKTAAENLRHSEERHREMFEHMSSGVAVVDVAADGSDIILRDLNSSAERFMLVDRAHVLDRPVLDMLPGLATTGLPEVVRRVQQTGVPEFRPPALYQDEHRSGWMESQVYRLPNGQVVVIFDDVSDRVETQQALHESNEQLRATIEHAPLAIIGVDLAGRIQSWNPAAERMLGWTAAEMLLVEPESQPGGFAPLFSIITDRVRHQGSFADVELRVPHRSGDQVPASISAGPLWRADGELASVLCVLMDITERTAAKQLLQASEERFRLLYERAPVPYQSLDASGCFVQVNETWLNLLGYDREEVIGRPFTEVLVPDERELFPRRFAQLMQADTSSGEQWTLVRADGATVVAEFEVRVQRYADGSFKQTHCVFHDVTARRRAERALRDSEERLAVTLRSLAEGVIATDVAGRIVLMNPAAETLVGLTQEQVVGQELEHVLCHVDEESWQPLPCPVAAVLSGGRSCETTPRPMVISRDGRRHSVTCSAAPIRNSESQIVGCVLVLRDITDEVRLRAEALKVEKLQSLSVLAGGLAHDFNNILLVTMGNLQVARLFDHGEARHDELLHNAERACKQAQDLTQQLLTFAKGGVPVREVASIADPVRDTALFAVAGSNVRCEFEADQDLWPVEADVGQLSQVINNLVINADQAMPDGGTLRLQLRNVELDERQGVPLPPGPYVSIAVADEGIGISPEHLDHVFDPYFTTKPTGNGLGLASCFSIISHHGGHISAVSEPGVGTTFIIYLPRSTREAANPAAADSRLIGGSGRILIMDDEPSVRDLGRLLLSELGYTVETVERGEEAIERYQDRLGTEAAFDAVILDLTIRGGMGGKETIAALRAIDPGVRAIVCSGYSVDPILAQYREYGFVGLVAKPYEVSELAEAVAEAVGGR